MHVLLHCYFFGTILRSTLILPRFVHLTARICSSILLKQISVSLTYLLHPLFQKLICISPFWALIISSTRVLSRHTILELFKIEILQIGPKKIIKIKIIKNLRSNKKLMQAQNWNSSNRTKENKIIIIIIKSYDLIKQSYLHELIAHVVKVFTFLSNILGSILLFQYDLYKKYIIKIKQTRKLVLSFFPGEC